MNIEEICTLSDPLGGLAKSWMEEWNVAVLKPNAYNKVEKEIWCVTDCELITNIKLLTDIDNKDERKHEENHFRYVSQSDVRNEFHCVIRISNMIYLHFSLFERASKLASSTRARNDSNVRSLHHTPGTRRITWQTTLYVVLVLLAAAIPISQLLIGHHYISIDKTHASQFLIANSVVFCYIVVLGLWKVSKRCIGLYKCCLKLFFIPLLVAICIGFGLLGDYHYWKVAFKENDYKFCDPIIFYMAYGLNIIDYIIFLGYAITIVSNYYY